MSTTSTFSFVVILKLHTFSPNVDDLFSLIAIDLVTTSRPRYSYPMIDTQFPV